MEASVRRVSGECEGETSVSLRGQAAYDITSAFSAGVGVTNSSSGPLTSRRKHKASDACEVAIVVAEESDCGGWGGGEK